MSAKPLRKCPQCGKLKLKRLIGTGAGIIFKGSGFYQTDYRSDSYKKSAEAEKNPPTTSTATPAEKTGETKSENKSAEKKTETKTTPKGEAT